MVGPEKPTFPAPLALTLLDIPELSKEQRKQLSKKLARPEGVIPKVPPPCLSKETAQANRDKEAALFRQQCAVNDLASAAIHAAERLFAVAADDESKALAVTVETVALG